MKLQKLTQTFIGLACLTVATNVFAFVREQGAYIEGNVGTNYSSVDLFGIHKSSFDSVGANVNLGYQLSRYFAPEVGYTYYGSGGINNIDAALKGILPFQIGASDFNIFGKLGVGYIFRGSNESVRPYLGLGAGYAVTPAVDLNVQAQGVGDAIGKLGLLSVGLTYHFN